MNTRIAGRKPSSKASIQRTVDLIAYELGFANYLRWLGHQGIDPRQDSHAQDGKKILKDYGPAIFDMMENHLEQFTELRNGNTLTASYMKAAGGRSVKAKFWDRIKFYERLLTWAAKNIQEIDNVFGKRNTGQTMRAVVRTSTMEEPSVVINKLASLASCSGLTRTRTWLEEAARLSGAEVDAVSKSISDTESAKNIVDVILEINRKLDVTDPVSEEAAELALERQEQDEILEETIANSRDPNATMTNAVDVASEHSFPQWIEEAGFNDEQKKFIIAEGNLLINAGAGSGKTSSLGAKVAYSVRELGYHPDQILATSFTRAAAGEIKERIKDKYNIESYNIGRTTHSIAGTVIKQFLPEIERKRQNLLNGNASAKIGLCMKMAYKQLQLESWMNRGTDYFKKAIGADRPDLAWVNIGGVPKDPLDRPISQKTFELLITRMRAEGISLEEAQRKHRGTGTLTEVAVAMWTAYEWLKDNNTKVGPIIDFDDMLFYAHKALVEKPEARKALQRQFKVLLIDEAQDQNVIQNEIFDIIGEKADTLAYIGDDRQCVEVSTSIMTPQGDIKAGALEVGQQVFSYRNGKITPQTVSVVRPSSWTWGYKITTKSGRTLTITPNHKIWASSPELEEEEHMVYLMYREDMGYRLGVTSTDSRDLNNPWGSRNHHEKADRLWVLEVCSNKEDALFMESDLSLSYGIPTHAFEAEKRRTNPDRVASLFAKFGENGAALLEEKHLRFDLPHWMSDSSGKQRSIICMDAHSGSNTQVSLEWSGSDLDQLKSTVELKNKKSRRWFSSYQDALQYAQDLQSRTGANLCRRLSTPEGMINLLTASGLHKGMSVAVCEGIEQGIVLDRIESIEKVDGSFVDLQVDDASNFFGGGILSHNSIYAFRGASPNEFVRRRDRGFKMLTMVNNYRSGANIVNAGEQLIAHNGDRQLPKTCRAVDKNGEGDIRNRVLPTHEDAAKNAVLEIAAAVNAGASPDDYGIIVRNNAEKDAFMIMMITQGVPYRSHSGSNFFKKPQVKAIVNWLKVAYLNEGITLDNALLHAHEAPGFMLDRTFRQSVERVNGSRLEFIIDGGRDQVYTGRSSWRNRSVHAYGTVVREIRELASSVNDISEVINYILGITGEAPQTKGGEPKSVLDWMTEKVDLQALIAESELDPEDITLGVLQDEAQAPISPLLAMAQKLPDPNRFMGMLAKLENAMNMNDRKAERSKAEYEPAVQIDTCHQWKGLEAENIYVLMAAGIWPYEAGGGSESESADEGVFDEERRLAYVAITRGKQNVTVLSPMINYRNKESGVSRFVREACIPTESEMLDETRQASYKNATEGYEGEYDESAEFDELLMEAGPSKNPLGDLVYNAFTKGRLE